MPQDYKPTKYRNVYWRGKVLYYSYRDETGKKKEHRFGKSGKPGEASVAQSKAQARADKIKRGLIDPREELLYQQSHRTILEIVDEYKQHLISKRNTKQHNKNLLDYLTRWISDCNITCLIDADPHILNQWLTGLNVSARTQNYARQSVLGLLRWAVSYNRMAINPCPTGLVPKQNENTDRRKLSRAMHFEDFKKLISVAPPHRQAYYFIAAFMGLRWREIARLHWHDFDFDAGVATVQANQTKNKKKAELPIPDPVIQSLIAIRPENVDLSTKIFNSEPTLRTWKLDLIKADIVSKDKKGKLIGYADDQGRIIDRKCLRLSFGTWLKLAGVDLRDAQKLLRHHDPALTSNIYTDVRLVDLKAASEKVSTIYQPKLLKTGITRQHYATSQDNTIAQKKA